MTGVVTDTTTVSVAIPNKLQTPTYAIDGDFGYCMAAIPMFSLEKKIDNLVTHPLAGIATSTALSFEAISQS